MKRIKVSVSIGLQGCEFESEIEVEDGASKEDIEEQVREWALGHVDWWGEEVS